MRDRNGYWWWAKCWGLLRVTYTPEGANTWMDHAHRDLQHLVPSPLVSSRELIRLGFGPQVLEVIKRIEGEG